MKLSVLARYLIVEANVSCCHLGESETRDDKERWLEDESEIGVNNICFQAFLLKIMTLADGEFAFTPALSHMLFISLQGLVHFSISKLISRKSLSILMRVALARSLTAGQTEGKNSWPFIIKGAVNLCVCVCVLLCIVDAVSMCLSAFTSLQQNTAWKTLAFHSQDRVLSAHPRQINSLYD